MKKILILLIIAVLQISTYSLDYDTKTYREKYGTSKDKKAKDIGELTIQSSGLENNIRDLSKSIEIITEEDIKKSGANDIIAVLDSIPGVKASYGFGKGKIDIRGQGDTSMSNVLILVDGVRVNSIDMSGPNLKGISLDIVERIEVINGGSTVLYGDGAVGGVINIITKSFYKGEEKSKIKAEYGNEDTLNLGVNYNEKFEFYSFNLSYFREKNNGYRDNNELKNQNINIGLNFFDKKKLKYNFKLKFSKYDSDFGLPGSLTKELLDKDRKQTTSPDDNSKNDEYNYYMSYEQIINKNTKMVLDYSKRDIKSRAEYFGSLNKIDTEQNDISLKSIVYYPDNKSSATVGYARYEGASDVEAWSKYSVEKESNAYFMYNKYQKGNYISTQGYRYEKIKFKESLNKEYSQKAYEASLNYLYSKTGNTYININTGYRVPNTDELGYGIAEFKAQTNQTYEIGIRDYKLKSFFNLALFYTETKNEIYYDDKEFANKNIEGKTERKGAEISLKQSFGKFDFNQSLSYINPKIKDGNYKGKYIPGVSKYALNLGIKYNFNKEILIAGNYRYNGSSYVSADFENKAGKEEAYGILDLRINYEKNNFILYVGGDNILGKKYNDFTGYLEYNNSKYYYPASEEKYYIGAAYLF